ncbi:Hypothetical predicted protein, partial [Paramuricea clavata]
SSYSHGNEGRHGDFRSSEGDKPWTLMDEEAREIGEGLCNLTGEIYVPPECRSRTAGGEEEEEEVMWTEMEEEEMRAEAEMREAMYGQIGEISDMFDGLTM